MAIKRFSFHVTGGLYGPQVMTAETVDGKYVLFSEYEAMKKNFDARIDQAMRVNKARLDEITELKERLAKQ